MRSQGALRARLDGYQSLVTDYVRELFERPSSAHQLYAMMSYHFGWLDEQLRPCGAGSGKRVRSVLCLTAAESVGGDVRNALPGAAALELLHNFSLVHDDIEDNSQLRRGRSTVWRIWGIPHGVNVGDAMCALAYLVLCEHADRDQALQAVGMLSRTNVELCEGQFLDLHYEEVDRVSVSGYLSMIRGKTAALFGCAAAMGALLAGAPQTVVSQLERFGRALGEAFQMQDDILGVWGDPSRTGKAAADIRDRKRALPAVLAGERAGSEDLATLSALYARPGQLNQPDVEWVLDLFDRLEIRRHAERMKQATLSRARELLQEALPAADAAEPLRQLVGAVVPPDDEVTSHEPVPFAMTKPKP